MTSGATTMTVRRVTAEHHREPVGIGEPAPRLSWIVDTDIPGWRQSAYELDIFTEGVRTWNSGRVESDESVLVPWGAPDLVSRERRLVRVRVWGQEAAEPSDWSEPATIEAGLLDPTDWIAQLIQPAPIQAAEGGSGATMLRHEFDLAQPVVKARLYATAHGIYEAELNGAVVGHQVLAPGWTSYDHRLRYQTYDVTHLLTPGPNAIGVHLADGWYRGYLGFAGTRQVYGDRVGAFVQLEVEFQDGSTSVITSDSTWRSIPSALTLADIYNGETYDVAAGVAGWSRAGLDASQWTQVDVARLDTTILVAPTGPPVRRIQTVPPVQISASPTGKTLVDFGQNLVGRIRFRLPDAPVGTTITVRHAEVLEEGELGTRPLRAARQTDTVVLDGSGPLMWEPKFTFHGFRYAEITGWPTDLTESDLEAVVIHTDLRPTGDFVSSDPLLNRLHENVLWGMRGNFVDVPTDCPQRDERLGWTGDLAVFAATASFLYDTSGMLTSWLADLAVEQLVDNGGIVPIFVPSPDIKPPGFPPLQAEAGWGDAAILVPWVLYQRHGDTEVLRAQWQSMTAWLDAFEQRAGAELDFPEGGFMLGDWLDTAAPPDNPAAARTPWQCVATAYLSRSARIMAEVAQVLGRESRAFAELADRAAARFRSEYVSPNGRLSFPSQTAYALALEFDLLLPEQRQHAGRLLAAQVVDDGFHIATGFLGTPFVTDALTNADELPTAYELLLQKENPSWLYPVTMGATTIWERWDSMLPDGSINPGDMTSFNHYAFGAVADWLHRTVAGLAPAAPGYRRIRVAPRPGVGVNSAAAGHETPYGSARVSWTLRGTEFELDVTVPPNCAAEVSLPDGSPDLEIFAGQHRFTRTIPEPVAVPKPKSFWSPE